MYEHRHGETWLAGRSRSGRKREWNRGKISKGLHCFTDLKVGFMAHSPSANLDSSAASSCPYGASSLQNIKTCFPLRSTNPQRHGLLDKFHAPTGATKRSKCNAMQRLSDGGLGLPFLEKARRFAGP